MNILIAGIGNIFQGDDAFGCEVAALLARRTHPEGVRVVDFGIRGIDLAYALMDAPDLTIFVDTVSCGGHPGTLYTIEPESEDAGEADEQGIDGHRMDPLQVLRSVKAMGVQTGRILLVGCEAGNLGGEEGCMGLTPEVQAVVRDAADLVESLVAMELEEVRV
jgi:hydrogenase maturation protease